MTINDRTWTPQFAKLSIHDDRKEQIAPVHLDFGCGVLPLSLMGLAGWLPICLSHSRCPGRLKIMAIVDRYGMPLSVSTHAANHHEVTLVQLSFDLYMIEAKPQHLIGNKAYDSDGLDKEPKKDGVEMIAPHRSSRKMKTQSAPLCTALDRRAILCVDPMEASPAGSLGLLRRKFPRIRATRVSSHATRAILR